MRKLIPITVVSLLLLSACSSIKHINGYESLTGLDFRPYADKGFLITPYAYSGEYISIYMVNYVIMPEANYAESGATNPNKRESSGSWVFDLIDVDDALNKIYETCVEFGADALMDFKIQPNSESYKVGTEYPVTVNGIQITGIAIKRQD